MLWITASVKSCLYEQEHCFGHYMHQKLIHFWQIILLWNCAGHLIYYTIYRRNKITYRIEPNSDILKSPYTSQCVMSNIIPVYELSDVPESIVSHCKVLRLVKGSVGYRIFRNRILYHQLISSQVKFEDFDSKVKIIYFILYILILVWKSN